MLLMLELLLMQHFWRHIYPISPAHLVVEGEVHWHVDELHHGDVRDSKPDHRLVNVQTVRHDHVLRCQILVHKVMVVEIAKLAQHLNRNLCDIFRAKRLA